MGFLTIMTQLTDNSDKRLKKNTMFQITRD